MIPELGNFLLMLALVVTAIQSVMPMIGANRGNLPLMHLALMSGKLQFVIIFCSFGCLVASFILNDFSVLNVANNSNSALPLPYKIAASWGSHEGSMLLWLLMLAGWTFAVAINKKQLPIEFLSRILAVMGFVSFGFLLFIIFTSNPFERILPPLPDGSDLNPLLQDPGMVIHPPMLYMGYVGCVVPFAFAVAALLGGKLDSTWARWSRPWTTMAWVFLTIGIALGSWWAYYELGWGGWWFWDPVENASFMPWLCATALMHSLSVSEKRGGFKAWTVLLAILTFSLSLLGTFLVRSGVITSVHAFASDPSRGVFILLFLTIIVSASLLLYAVRAPRIGSGSSFEWISREGALLANNVLFLASTAAILLGTLYPLFLDALNLGKISVGPPYFDVVFVSLTAPAVFFMGIGPLAHWRKTEISFLLRRIRGMMLIALFGAVLLLLITPRWSPLVLLGLFLALWIIGSIVTTLVERVANIALKTRFSKLHALKKIPLGFWGMLTAHFGVAVFIVGITMVGAYESEKDYRMEIGDSAAIGKYTFVLDGFENKEGPNFNSTVGKFSVFSNKEFLVSLSPEKRFYHVQQMVMTEASIDTGITRDLYLSLGEPLNDGSWVVRIYYKPFVVWIWFGAFIMALGGIMAAFDRRFNLNKQIS
ncbi:MAG: c-type cytochrome biogenesis protein CcmF [Proteobacteria bacterium]|nr:c-type cytochrome biogenesis protein CcmF [Pseudomonadota bacterium]